MARPLILLALGIALLAQRMPVPDDHKTDPRLKREQIEAILKEDRAKSIEDAAEISKLSEELKTELEKNDKNILSVTALKKAEEIEKLAKRIRGRLRRY